MSSRVFSRCAWRRPDATGGLPAGRNTRRERQRHCPAFTCHLPTCAALVWLQTPVHLHDLQPCGSAAGCRLPIFVGPQREFWSGGSSETSTNVMLLIKPLQASGIGALVAVEPDTYWQRIADRAR